MEINTDLHIPPRIGNPLKSLGNAKSVMPPKDEGVKLFGVTLTENITMMRKAVSMGNLSCYNSASAQPLQPCTPEHSESGDPHGYVSDGLVQNSGSLRERKKGVPWTEDEHRMFLVGLQKLGKGDWRGISRNFVPSRTPTQVASHAQKYFLRQSNLNKRKRRSSLFDIISSNTVPTSNSFSPAALELTRTNPKLSFNPTAATLESAHLNMNSLESDLTSFSADLCLGRTHELQQRSPPPWPHTFSSQQHTDIAKVQSSSSTSDCMQLLPPLSFMSQRLPSENEMARPGVTEAYSSAATSSSLSSLCRIDEGADLSANLRLSIGPSILLEPIELSLKLDQPVARHSVAMAGANNSNTLTNAIRVV